MPECRRWRRAHPIAAQHARDAIHASARASKAHLSADDEGVVRRFAGFPCMSRPLWLRLRSNSAISRPDGPRKRRAPSTASGRRAPSGAERPSPGSSSPRRGCRSRSGRRPCTCGPMSCVTADVERRTRGSRAPKATGSAGSSARSRFFAQYELAVQHGRAQVRDRSSRGAGRRRRAKRGKFCEGEAAAPGMTMISLGVGHAVAVACRSTGPSPWSRAFPRGTRCPVRPEAPPATQTPRGDRDVDADPARHVLGRCSDRAAGSCFSPIGSPFCTANA